jgi:uncharacterized OB-fold protein
MIDQRLPGPLPSLADAGFWSACRQHELRMRQCQACQSWHHPPMPLCPRCQSQELEWRLVEGPALLYTWSRVHVALHSSVAASLPYYIAVVEFPACDGVRLIAGLEHTDSLPPAIGSECQLLWVIADSGQPIPGFRTRPRDAGAAAT